MLLVRDNEVRKEKLAIENHDISDDNGNGDCKNGSYEGVKKTDSGSSLDDVERTSVRNKDGKNKILKKLTHELMEYQNNVEKLDFLEISLSKMPLINNLKNKNNNSISKNNNKKENKKNNTNQNSNVNPSIVKKKLLKTVDLKVLPVSVVREEVDL
jgi:hypothetical protein